MNIRKKKKNICCGFRGERNSMSVLNHVANILSPEHNDLLKGLDITSCLNNKYSHSQCEYDN